MIDKISLLTEAASKIGSDSLTEELRNLEMRYNSPNVPVMIPLLGEFSSGKTSLINALTDSKALETATKPTTATIFEIHFGAPFNHAQVLKGNGDQEEITDISTLKNERLSDATVVTVFDTSKNVSPYTILIDTPGISSPDPRHQQVLMDFLPQADALLLVIDINQPPLTKSLSEFLKSASLSDIEINVVLTKSETKSTVEIASAKKDFMKNCDFNIRKLVAVSAFKNDLSELYTLFKEIESRKNDILNNSMSHRLKTISEQILANIETLLNASFDTSSLQSEIQTQKNNLRKIHRRIDRMVDDINGELEDLTRENNRKFEDQVFSRLSSIINAKSQNYDGEAIAAINSIASAIIGDYRQKVMKILAEKANQTSNENDLSISALTGIDLSGIGINGLSYNLDLNSMGHEYDSWIKGGVIALGAAAAIGVVAATAGAAGAAAAADSAIDIADTVSDVGSMVSNRRMKKSLETAVKYGTRIAEKYSNIENINNNGYSESGVGKGMIDSLAGLIAEKTMSKPQRSRAIRKYIEDCLAPEFRSQLQNATSNIIAIVKDTLNKAAQSSIDNISAQLKNLKEQMSSNKSAADARKAELRELQTKILTL